MTTTKSINLLIEHACLKANHNAQQLSGRKIKSNARAVIASGCFAIAQQHHNSILILLKNNPPLHATAFSILRSLLEATIKGVWIYHTATEDEVDRFPIEDLQKSIKTMVKEIGSQIKNESIISKDYWNILCSYTHTGEWQIRHWLSSNDIEPFYSEKSIKELLKQTEQISSLLYSQILKLSSKEE